MLAGVDPVTYFLSSLMGLVVAGNRFPPINRWAIFFRPAGLRKRHRTNAHLHLVKDDNHQGKVYFQCRYGQDQEYENQRAHQATHVWLFTAVA